VNASIDAVPGPSSEDLVTREQLHGEACIVCGGSPALLIPAGHFYTPGRDPNSRQGWAVVACREHLGVRASIAEGAR